MFFNIVISLAGKSQRFFDEGFTKPKYYLPMGDERSMIEHSIDSLNISGNLILIVQKEDCEKYEIDKFLKEKYPNRDIKFIEKENDLEAFVNNDTPLIILSCDYILEWDSTNFLKKTLEDDLDGCVLRYDENKESIKSFKKSSYYFKNYETLNILNFNINKENYFSVETPEQYYSYLETKFGSIKSKDTLDTMKRGWLVGNFTPSILRTNDFEVAYMRHKKGEYWLPHVHSEISEYNVLIRGKMKMNNELISEGEIFNIPKKMLTHARFLEDCEVLCIKTPSVPSDKHCY